jgi:hypothetical protein
MQPYDVQMRGTRIARVPGDVVISARRRQTIFWGACAAVLALGLVVAWTSQPTMTGKIEAAVLLGSFIALCAFLWWFRNHLRPRIQVTPDEIRYWHMGRHLQFTLSRQSGGGLCVIPALHRRIGWTTPAASWGPFLTFPGTGHYMGLRRFHVRAVRRACESRGWRFDGDVRLLARDARALWQEGKLWEAAHLVDVFGPFDEDDDGITATTSLGAAILEAYGDSLATHRASGNSASANRAAGNRAASNRAPGNTAAARAAYQRAADAQRSYAAFATSGSEGSARMSEAARLDAKAHAPGRQASQVG